MLHVLKQKKHIINSFIENQKDVYIYLKKYKLNRGNHPPKNKYYNNR